MAVRAAQRNHRSLAVRVLGGSDVALLRRRAGLRIRAAHVLTVSIALWTVVLSTIAFSRHDSYRTHRFDLGNMTQVVWTTAHGHFLEQTLGGGQQASRLASHADPILAAIAPLWLVWPSPKLLLLLQSFALAIAAVPVFWLGRKYSQSPRLGLALALAYLLYPATLWNGVIDFHPVSLAVPFIAFGIWFLDNERRLAFIACAVAAATTSELMPLLVGLLGIGYAGARGRWRFGLAVATAGTAWSALDLLVLIPHFKHGSAPALARYRAFGSSPDEIGASIFIHPLRVIHAATSPSDIAYVGLFVVPLLGLFVAAPGISLGAVPQLALNLTSSFWSTNRIQYQYALGIVAFVFPAAAVAIQRVQPRRRGTIVGVVLALVVLSSLLRGPRPGDDRYAWAHAPDRAHLSALRAAVARVPANVPVSATNQIGGHLSARRYVYTFPVTGRAHWLVVDTSDPWLATAGQRDDRPAFARAFAQLLASPRWRLVCSSATVFVFRTLGPRSTATSAGAC
jgi:uncharacterized membrane protein